jgi:serine/threonine protein kinase
MDAVMPKDGVRAVAEVLQRARQLADAIDAAANAGVHHGMLAPCDVILDGERTGVTGFGLAQALIRAGIPAQAEAPYGSPQRLAGAPPTRADDVYSLAAITLELLIGIPRPAPHETRLFTTIAGVDAGKLRASFAAAFANQPSERPSTASAFVASVEDAFSATGGADEAPSSAPVLGMTRAEAEEDDGETLELFRPEAVVDTPETRVARLQPVADVESFPEDRPQRSISFVEAPYRTPVRSGSQALLIAVTVVFSLGVGFGGGFIVGQRSTPSTESINVKHLESVAEPEPSRAVIDDPQPIVPTTPVAPISEEKVVSSEPVDATVPRQRAAPATAATKSTTGSLHVASRPSGAQVFVDDTLIGTTPLLLSNVAPGSRRLRIEMSGYRIWTSAVQIAPSERFRVSASLEP